MKASTSVYLSPEQLDNLSTMAEKFSLNRSLLFRFAIDQLLSSKKSVIKKNLIEYKDPIRNEKTFKSKEAKNAKRRKPKTKKN